MDPSKFTFQPKSDAAPKKEFSFASFASKASSGDAPVTVKPSPFSSISSLNTNQNVISDGQEKGFGAKPTFGQTAFQRKPMDQMKIPISNPPTFGANVFEKKAAFDDGKSFALKNPFEAAKLKQEKPHPNFGQTYMERRKLQEERGISKPEIPDRKRATMQPYEAKKGISDRITKRPMFDVSKFKFVRKQDAPPAQPLPGTDETDENPMKFLKSVGSAPNLDNNAVIPDDKLWKPKIPQQSRIEVIKSRESSIPRSFSPELKDDAKLIKKLAELEGRECAGEYEKYAILDERDKILYQLRAINSPVIKQLERCEEMCTEKERYMRIVQKRSSPFECDEATFEVAHQMMVKEYARSAADQERPLPHELRSEKMMEHTMSYLLSQVLDKFPETAEQRTGWYNFLWSRTRAVRKEVTQLSMSDTLALELVERCTRLHILFGYILCDLEVDHFDQKMNNENLGKCLQTLRHLYEDFERRGIKCVNEPEFRSYDVMMHMNDSNVFSQVLSYRSEVRQSPSVCLALQLSISFQNNNYCKFFRLLKSQATYLQCCMSHKLFNEIRSKAVNVITSSYGRNAGYPLDKFCSLLAYDSIDDLKSALDIYGLRIDMDGDQVVLNRDFLSLNDPIPMRPYEWIDKKKNGRFSQVVYGPTLFNFFATFRDVSNSFDHHNLYTKDPILRNILGVNRNVPKFPVTTIAPPRPNPLEITIEQKRKMEELRKMNLVIESLSTNVIDQIVRGLVEEEKMKERMRRKFENEKRRKEEEQRKILENQKKRVEIEQRVARRIQENLENKIVDDILCKIIDKEAAEQRKRREIQIAEKMTNKFWEKIVIKFVDSHVSKICGEFVEHKNQIRSKLENFKQNISRQWLLQFCNHWREWAKTKKAKRIRRAEKIRECIPKWEAAQDTSLLRKYDREEKKMNLSPKEADTFVRSKIIEKRREHRIARRVLSKWQQFAAEKREIRKMATEMCRKENAFFEKFGKLEILRKRTFTFDDPEEIVERKRSPKREPLRESKSFSVFEASTSSAADITVARDQIETWKHDGMPSELKEKLKRRRESFEKEQNEHILKKNKQEEIMIGDIQKQTSKMDKMSEEASKLLEEANNFKNEMRKFMCDLEIRRVSQQL
ncbi:unnamed protein product [Caenorhabditis angaria]|uniref:SAC3/GANP/THP3 conserved domain-containing protein n=1 Tax=Caenorhabditis angaria TaxID=860376 RepID=A0A9P1IPZ7_9PELO|nr:unnamed protein product [Caenorhabditis angaria]